MKISLHWLKDYVDLSGQPEEIAERLTMAGLEVENIEKAGDKYKNFVVGEVLEVTNHPNAEKLTVCKVNSGKAVLKIVCGAPNVSTGQKVVVGLVGAIVPRNQHRSDSTPLVLGQAEIRGETSEGMICSEYELDIGEDSEGILVLEKRARVGTPFARYLGLEDTVLDVAVTPNRPDCLSHIGVAREVAAFLRKKVKVPHIQGKEIREHVSKAARVTIETKVDCPRYSARVVRDVQLGDSPVWMQQRLRAIGIRPINNVVDITNYVVMELGIPLHAFDYDKLAGHRIVVRRAHDDKRFTTLDGAVRELHEDMLLICDRDKPVAIAGVMGGLNTEISDTTRNVLIEGAYFNPTSIRRTSKNLAIMTEASQRFERGVDPNMTVFAVERAAQLMGKIARGRVLKGVIDQCSKKFVARKVLVRVGKVNEVLGTSLSKKEITESLSRLEILRTRSKVSREQDAGLLFSVPTFRPDLEKEIDLIEEIGRTYGYDRIETKMRGHIRFSERTSELPLEDKLREWLASDGFNEVVANSMQEKSFAALSSEDYVEMLNPISKEMGALRTSLLPGLLEIAAHNFNHGTKNLRLFEIGKVYFCRESSDKRSRKDYEEEDRLLLAISGEAAPTHWDVPTRLADIFDLKGEFETLFSKIFLDKVKFIYYPNSKTLTDPTVGVEINKTYMGLLGRVNEQAKRLFDIKQDVFVGELSLEVLRGNITTASRYLSLPKYPSVTRDLAFVVNEDVSAEELRDAVREGGGDLVQSVELFDVYVGDKIGSGKKSMAFAVQLMSRHHTLTDEEIEDRIDQIVSVVASRFQARLRAL